MNHLAVGSLGVGIEYSIQNQKVEQPMVWLPTGRIVLLNSIEACPGVTVSQTKGLGVFISLLTEDSPWITFLLWRWQLGCGRFWEPGSSMLSGSALLLIRVKWRWFTPPLYKVQLSSLFGCRTWFRLSPYRQSRWAGHVSSDEIANLKWVPNISENRHPVTESHLGLDELVDLASLGSRW